MTIEQGPSFDPKSFLAKVGEGRSIGSYSKDRIVFTQGGPKSPSFPSKGRKPSSHSSGRMNFAAKVAWPASRGELGRLRQ